MKTRRWIAMALILALVVALLLPATVAADELWIRNPGALHIQVWSDTPYEDVNVLGCIDASASEDIDAEVMAQWETTGSTGMWVAGPGWEPEDGKFEVAAIAIPDPAWIVIEADNITRWNVIESVDGYCEWIDPEVRLVTSAELEAAKVVEAPAAEIPTAPRDYDSGPSIQEVNAVEPVEPVESDSSVVAVQPEPIEYDFTGEEYWLWT